MITADTLAQAAKNGTGVDHLTAAQVWAAHHLNMAPEHLTQPLAYHIEILLAAQDQKARRAFFGSAQGEDTEAMINAAYDEQHPMYLRLPILETLREGFDQFFPDLKPSGVDGEGNAMFSTADLARALEMPEEELLDDIERRGWSDRMSAAPTHILH